MVKKKKAKGGKKAAKKDAIESQKKPKEPTEKELFEMQVKDLRVQLELTHGNLTKLEAEQEACRTQFEGEAYSKESCVAHLRRVLRRESERRSEVQERLRTERELGELVERRVLERSVLVDRNNETSRGVALQQKMEIQGKLSLLEELRLARDSQRANLRRIEWALAEKAAALSQKTREEDRNQVDRLLRNREGFVRMCKEVKTEWSDAFKLRMPVHAQKQLEENIRLRGVCRDTTKTLLQAQDQNRVLKQHQKSLNLEEEIQNFAEENAEDRKGRQESRLKRLLKVRRQLTSAEDPKSQRIFGDYPVEKDGSADSPFLFRPRSSSSQEIHWNDDDQDSCKQETSEDNSDRSDEEYKHSREQQVNARRDSFEKEDPEDTMDRNAEECQQNRRQEDSTKQDSPIQMASKDNRTWNMNKFREIQENIANTKKDSLAQKNVENSRARNSNESRVADSLGHDKHSARASAKRVADGKMTPIKRCRIDRCRLEDTLRDGEAILEDQLSYRRSLESQIEKQNVERNGAMMSAILRAGKIFESRCCRTEKNDADLDFDVLHQIRMLLDLSDLTSTYCENSRTF